MKNISQCLSVACVTLTIYCGQLSHGQEYVEYEIVDPSSSVYVYNEYGQSPVYSESVVESSMGYIEQSAAVSDTIISKDFGYGGPGTMRDHLWLHHSDDLKARGTSQDALMALTDAEVQTLHNEFHAAEMEEFLNQHPGASVQQSEHSPQEESSGIQATQIEASQPQSEVQAESGFTAVYTQPSAAQGGEIVGELITVEPEISDQP